MPSSTVLPRLSLGQGLVMAMEESELWSLTPSISWLWGPGQLLNLCEPHCPRLIGGWGRLKQCVLCAWHEANEVFPSLKLLRGVSLGRHRLVCHQVPAETRFKYDGSSFQPDSSAA
jgi:hypothetical protein